MPEVRDEDLDLMDKALGELHGQLAAGGTDLRKDFRPDEVYDRAHPVEKIASKIRSCANTGSALRKEAQAAAKDRDESAKTAEWLSTRAERMERHLAKTAYCADCGGTGEKGGADCGACESTGIK